MKTVNIENSRYISILAKNLRILRAKDNGRQDAIAFVAGLSRTHMGMLENGKVNPSFETLEKSLMHTVLLLLTF